MSIIVTGGLGFIGSNYISEFIGLGSETIVNVDNLSHGSNKENLIHLSSNPFYVLEECDIGDFERLKGIFEKYSPSGVIHFAAESHVDRAIENPKQFLYSNVVGTFNVLECAKLHWESKEKKLRKTFRMVNISTDEVYGDLPKSEASSIESGPYKPTNFYSATKASANHMVMSYFHTYEFPVIVTNSTNNYGPFQSLDKFIPKVINSALKGREIPIYGDGRQTRDWIYVKDNVAAIKKIYEIGVPGETYNIGAGVEIRNIDLANMVCEILDHEKPRENRLSYKRQIAHVDDRLGHDKRYSLNTSKIKNDLGIQIQYDFKDALKDTILWYLSKPQESY